MGLIQYLYVVYRQYFYTTLAILTMVWKRISKGEGYFRMVTWGRPEILDKGWHHKFVQLKNIRLHYVGEGPEDGEVLVMVHGFPEFWYSWRFQLREFEKTHRCLALDMRGYSESEKPSSESHYNISHLIEDIREFIETLAPAKKVYLAAHDWGAVVCWRVALIYPDLLKKLIILNLPHPSAFWEVSMKSSAQRAKSWYVYLFQTSSIPELGLCANEMENLEKMMRGKHYGIRNRQNFSDEDMLAWKYVFSQPGGLTGPLNYYRQMFRPGLHLKQTIVKVPVLIIWGDQDAFLELDGAKESIKYCTSCRLEIIKGASHWVQQDEPERVNELIREFLEP